jgi:hypothetical protein
LHAVVAEDAVMGEAEEMVTAVFAVHPFELATLIE